MEFVITLWHARHGYATQCVGGNLGSATASARACCTRENGWQVVSVTQVR